MKKRGLVTIPRLPFPLNSGGKIAIYDTIKSLSKKYELVIIIIDDNEKNKEYLDEIGKFSKEIYFFSKKRHVFIFNALRGVFHGKPLQVGYFYFNDVQNLVNKISKGCDFFFAFMIRTTTYGMDLPLRKYHYAIDSMFLNYKNSEINTKSFFWKLIYKIEIPLLFKTEKKQIENYDFTSFVNKQEASFWKDYGNVETLSHGVDDSILNYQNIDSKYSNVVAFIGKMDYRPNIDAVLWFCNNVLVLLDTKIEFWILGGYPTNEILQLEDKYDNVRVLGFVEDPYSILQSCICTVAPMQTGGGLQTKILMAMAVGSLVVSTSLPVYAIQNAQHKINLLVEDDPLDMAGRINSIYKNPHDYHYIKLNAHKLIQSTYSLEVIEKILFDLIEKKIS
uniref:glycosyltransferase n=1 Tax=Bacteroidota TaxID=976 RepID=UPI0040471732